MLFDINVKHELIYGKHRFRPKNQSALFLTKILGKKTLSAIHLKICREAGYKVNVEELNDSEILKV